MLTKTVFRRYLKKQEKKLKQLTFNVILINSK